MFIYLLLYMLEAALVVCYSIYESPFYLYGSDFKSASKYNRRALPTVSGVTNMCPGLNFHWHEKNENIMPYSMDLLSVEWIGANIYELTIHVKGKEHIDLKYLHSLKIIGINGPEGTKKLYGKNENKFLIDDPTDFTTKIQVYGQPYNGDDCKAVMPPFQIQYEYLQGEASQYWETWKWGRTAFDLMTGCSADKDGNCNADFPLWYWANPDSACGSSGVPPAPSDPTTPVPSGPTSPVPSGPTSPVQSGSTSTET